MGIWWGGGDSTIKQFRFYWAEKIKQLFLESIFQLFV
jgi:hypothetical protein